MIKTGQILTRVLLAFFVLTNYVQAQSVQWTTTTANGDTVRPVKSTQGAKLPFLKFNDNSLQTSAAPYFYPAYATQSQSKGTYDAFGHTVRLPGGDYAFFYRKGADHATSKGVLVMQTTSDIGVTLGALDTVVSDATYDIRNFSIGIAPGNRVIVGYARYNYLTDTFIDLKVIYSDDTAQTWSSPYTVTGLEYPRNSFYGAMIEIEGDKLLMAVHDHDDTTWIQKVIISSDTGKTWGAPITVLSDTTLTMMIAEASFVYVGDSTIIGLIRRNADSQLQQVKSTNNGTTWSNQGKVTVSATDDAVKNTMPWLATFLEQDRRMIVAYYFERNTQRLGAMWGYADSIAVDSAGWIEDSKMFLSDRTRHYNSGYPSIIHPDDTPQGFGWYYDQNSAGTSTIIRFISTPFLSNIATRGDVIADGNLMLTGLAYVDSVIGSYASGGNLFLQSTSHETKGKIFLGANSAFDEVNNRLGLGTTSPTERIVVSGAGSQRIFATETGSSVTVALIASSLASGFVGTNTNHPFSLITLGTTRWTLSAPGHITGASGMSITTSGLNSFTGNTGTATIGAGDSVTVSITGLTTSGVATVSYKTASPMAADTAAQWNIHATNTLSLYGKYGWIVSYIIGSK